MQSFSAIIVLQIHYAKHVRLLSSGAHKIRCFVTSFVHTNGLYLHILEQSFQPTLGTQPTFLVSMLRYAREVRRGLIYPNFTSLEARRHALS